MSALVRECCDTTSATCPTGRTSGSTSRTRHSADAVRDGVRIIPVPGASASAGPVNFGVAAARALAEKKIDGFWANGMGAELAVRSGAGTIVLDVRRGDGPKGCFDYTFASLAAADRSIERSPEIAAAAVRAIAKTHAALKADCRRAGEVGRKIFPPAEADLIVELVRRDLPYYDTAISRQTIAGLNRFAREMGILDRDVPYEAIVPAGCSALWMAPAIARGDG